MLIQAKKRGISKMKLEIPKQVLKIAQQCN